MKRIARIFAVSAAFFIALGFSAALSHSQQPALVLNFPESLPANARFFAELDARENNADKRKSFNEFLDLFQKKLPSKIELPSTEGMGFRAAFAIYGPAKVQQMLPGFLVLFEVENPAGFEPLAEKFREKLNVKGAQSRKSLGWKIMEDTAPRYAAWAEKNRIRIFSSHPGLLQEVIETIEGKKLPDCLAASSLFQEAFQNLPAGSDRVFIDLEGLIGDADPFLTIFGGEKYKEIKKTYLDPLRFMAAVGGIDNIEKGVYRSEARVALNTLKGDVEWLKTMSEKGLEIPSLFSDASYLAIAVTMPPGGATFAEPVWGTFSKFARKAQHAPDESESDEENQASVDTIALHEQLMKNLAAITEAGILVDPSSRGFALPVFTGLLNTRSAEAAADIIKMFPGDSLARASTRHWVVYSDTDHVGEMIHRLAGITECRKGLFALSYRFPLREVMEDSSAPDITWQGRADWRFKDGEIRGSSIISPDPIPAIRAAMIVGLFTPPPKEPDFPAAESPNETVTDQSAPQKVRPPTSTRQGPLGLPSKKPRAPKQSQTDL